MKTSHYTAAMSGLVAATLSVGVLGADNERGEVEGTVSLSPGCSGPTREGTASCRVPYADVEVRLLAGNGAMLTGVYTSAIGRYRLTAPPGHYRVQVVTPTKITRCPMPSVTVTTLASSLVDIDCDSGMR